MKFAYLEANLGGGWSILVNPILLFSLLFSERSAHMIEIAIYRVLTGTSTLTPINQQ